MGRDEVERMNSILAHRGPDGVGAWCDGAIGLGHRMLHTTPESLHEVLPLVDQASGLVVTADARIDNREELISLLDLRDGASVEIADSRIILAAYEKWGEGCAQRLLGDFAFAIWDGRRRRLFCARDVMGVKPFYYYHGAGTFVFASEIKGILCLEEVPRKLNEVKVADYLVPIFNDQVSSYYEGIVRLPPANSMTLAGGKLELRSYWRLDPSRELQLGGDDEYVEAFRELFIEAVHCRMRSAFAVGSTLSGGLDSSSIACTAGKLRAEGGQPRLHTFSAIFPSMVEEDPRIDERPYIEAVLAKGLFEPHYVRADQCQPLADVAWHQDEVLAAPNLYLTSLLFRSAYEHQVRVLLSGFDGDVTVSYGFEYLEMLAQLGRWATFAQQSQILSQRFGGDPLYYLRCHGIPHLTSLARRLRWWSFGRQAFEISNYFALSGQRLILDAVFKPMFYQPLMNAWCGFQRDNSPTSTADVLNGAINPKFARRIGLRERVKTFENEASEFVDLPRQQHIAQ
ncbi:MAG: lasso peptide isopeptide bond-forming cyclase, partial [Deltaproteobacteria bacterium]|nr:lasso peptide isopeptide bond-forming cyclase [Deltaproteobacteria bacterium]